MSSKERVAATLIGMGVVACFTAVGIPLGLILIAAGCVVWATSK